MKDRKLAYIYYNFRNRLGHSIQNPRFFKHYLRKLMLYKNTESTDGFLISYPKSGRTWLQKIIVEAAKYSQNISDPIKDITDIGKYINEFPRIVPTHACGCWEEEFSIYSETDLLKVDYSTYLDKPIVFMHRDPRDVLVSQYYHMKFRTRISSIDKRDLIDSKWIGIDKQITYLNKWARLTSSKEYNILAVNYESLHQDSMMVIQKVCKHWEINLTESSLKHGLQQSTLRKMKTRESKNAPTPWTYTPSQEENSFHARKGKIGEHTSFFTEQELSEINEKIKEKLHPFYEAYVK